MATLRPSELAVTLSALPGEYGGRDGWVVADEVRHRLELLGFDVTAQMVAARLRAMSRAQQPWVESRPTHIGVREYRVTSFGRSDVANQLRGVHLATPWLPVMRA